MSERASLERDDRRWLDELKQPAPGGAYDSTVSELTAYLRGTLRRLLSRRQQEGVVDLDDLVQESLVRVLRSLDRFRGDSRFLTWVSAVAVRTAFEELRRRRYREAPEVVLEVGREDLPDTRIVLPAERLEGDQLLDLLERAIRQDLTDRQRHAVLGELAGVPTVILAERLGTNPNALYKLHHDARRRLRESLLAAGFGPEDLERAARAGSDRP